MKFFEIDEEYLKKGGLITRDKKSGLAFGIVNGRLVAFKNGVKIEPEEIFKGYATDLLASDWEYISYDSKKSIWKPEDDEKYYPRFMNTFFMFDLYPEIAERFDVPKSLKEFKEWAAQSGVELD